MIMMEAVSMKRKIIPHLNNMLERGKLASTAIGKVIQLGYSDLMCRSVEVHPSFVSPLDREFSCSSTPAHPFSFHHISKSRNRGNKHVRHLKYKPGHQVERLFINGFIGRASPLQGFGHSPEVRQLRVTDSPFSVTDVGECHDQVDKKAEDFIRRFYKDLESQP